MTRRNISLPDDLDRAARDQGLNVSALAQQAIVDALDRHSRMSRLNAWLDELDTEHGPPSAEAVEEAEAWVASAAPTGAEMQGAQSETVAGRRRTVAGKVKSGKITSTRVVQTASRSALSQASRRTRRAER